MLPILFFNADLLMPLLIYQAAPYLRLPQGGLRAVSSACLFLAHVGGEETAFSTSTKTKLMFITCFRQERKVRGAEEASVIRSQQSIRVIGGPQSPPHIREEAARWWIRSQRAETKDKNIQDGGRVRLPPRPRQCEVTALMSGSGTCRQAGGVEWF